MVTNLFSISKDMGIHAPINRCSWCGDDPLYVAYHDTEWGVPEHDDQNLFELLTLEGAQAGLSWITVLRRRETYKVAFDQFDVETISHYDEKDIARLLADPGIIRNKLKVQATISNALAFIKIQKEFGTFDQYLWGFVGGKPIIHSYRHMSDLPAHTLESDALSKDLQKRGFRFVGSTICYAFMQATGMVNDHVVSCFRYSDLTQSHS